MQITEQLLKKILVNTKLVSQKDFDLLENEAKEKGEPLEKIILEKDLIADEELGQLIADEIGFPFVNLRKVKIDKNTLEIIPEIVAEKQGIIAFERVKDGLKLAMQNPENLEIREFIERKTGEKVIPYFASQRDVRTSLKFYKREIKEEFEELVGKTLKDIKTPESLKLPIIKMVDLILNYGYENRASDIHFEPYHDKTIIRYRIDGVLHDVLTLPKLCHDSLVSRIKILSKLRTDLHEAAQDGRFSFDATQEKVDVRVSVVPVEEGEKIVLRVLSERARRFSLEDLGLLERDFKIVRRNIKKPWGMILVVGPTGSGKTTTLYAILKILNTREVNIMTIEDPIEYDIEGVNQIQVNPKTNLTFSQGLRSIIRQNPDIIMVGEIRDEETASLGVNAAMTGHLFLSTFHSNDSATTLPRLLDMGIEPFLVSSTLNVVIAQRLVRKICPKCIESYEIPFAKVSRLLGKDLALRLADKKTKKIRLFQGRGCPLCQKTGYLGRIGIFEILEISEPIKKMIMEKSSSSQVKKEAQKLGMRTLLEDGLEKVEKGVTTLEEILRATKE